jgi:hypothetical protein
MTAAVPTVRFSHLRAYGRSAMHGHLARSKEMKPTAAMELGSAVHALVLDNHAVIAYPGATRRGKEWEAFKAAQSPKAIILAAGDYEKAQGMAKAVAASEVAKPYLQGEVEETIEFPYLYLPCRATPDVRGRKFITELKTAMTSDPARFQWHALRMHYHAQMMMQLSACDWKGYDKVEDAYIVCVESAEPYPVTVFKFTVRALDAGYKLLTLWAERLKNCELSNEFPAYSQAVVELDVPDDTELEFGSEPLEEVAA